MTDFMLVAAAFILAMVALGLVRIVRGPALADRMMGVLLMGSGGIASLLLWATAASVSSATDVALFLALLAAFASIALVIKGGRPGSETADMADGG